MCAECNALLSRYRLVARSYAKLAEKLEDMAVLADFRSPAFQRLKEETIAARHKCIRAKEALRVHKDDHVKNSS
jgi:hypothetical protein